MSSASRPLVVGILFPQAFDASGLSEHLGPVSSGLDIREIPYADSHDIRLRKTAGEPAETLRPDEAALTELQREQLAEVEVALALDVPIDIVGLAPRLRWVQAIGAGVEHLIRVFRESDVAVSTSAGVGAPAIAEFVIGRLLQLYKQLPALDEQQRNSTWRPCRGQMLAGRTMAIVGLGAIGTEVARRAHAFDMRVVAIRRRIEAGGPPFVEVHGPDELGHVVAMVDVIVISAAATAATESLIGANELASMRQGSILCNVARGSLVDEDAVIEALQSGRLRAAILDVTRDEPLPSASPLWTTPGVYLSSHSSATVEEYTHAMTRMFAENLRAYLEGRSPRNTVEFARGY